MPASAPREYIIKGQTADGQPFRPSDWAERLAGAMSCFRPEGIRGGIGSFIGYSPLCVPQTIDGVRCVIVNEHLKAVEPMAWDFVMNFARDNQLPLVDSGTGPLRRQQPGRRRPEGAGAAARAMKAVRLARRTLAL